MPDAVITTPELDQQLAAILATHHSRDGALLPILHAVQARFGYLPEASFEPIAKALQITRAELYGVITFYHDFRLTPPPRHRLQFCRAEACQCRGADDLGARLQTRLGLRFGEESPDGQWGLEAVYCLGLCAIGPAALIDGQPVARLTDAKLQALIAERQL